GSLDDFAHAVTAEGKANALADVTLDPPGGAVTVLGNLTVQASASNKTGHGPGNVAASANAALTFEGARTVTVDGLLGLHARTSNSGSGQVVTKTAVNFGPAIDINLGGVLITDSALNARSEEHTSELQSLTNLVC